MVVVGDDAGLGGVVRAVELALSEGAGALETFAADGEGYKVVVIRLRDPESWELLRLPYVSEYAADKRGGALEPRGLLARLRSLGELG